MGSVGGDRPWQRPDRRDPAVPGPGHAAAGLALLCAVLAPVTWLAVACAAAMSVDGRDGPDGVAGFLDLAGLVTLALVALLATGTLLSLLRRRPPLRRPVGTVAVAVAAVLAPAALLALLP